MDKGRPIRFSFRRVRPRVPASDMLDPEDYPQPEVSGSALMTFALAWGADNGILDGAGFMPAIAQAWRGLVGQIYATGRLGNVQQPGAAPAHYPPSSDYNYGVGAFLLAGAQIADLVEPSAPSRHAHGVKRISASIHLL
jgi:unsaturated rhamnogalacturonyl hydrolase